MDERERHREVLAINRAIAGAEDYDEVLRRVVEGTAAFTGATACLLLLTQDDGLARVVRSVGIEPGKAARLAVPLSERIDRDLCALLGFRERDEFVGVPVIGKQGMMGVLAIYRQAPPAAAGAHDDELISAFADQAAIALDNAERIRRLREAREREVSRQRALLLASVTEELNKGTELRQVIDVAVRRGIEVLGRKDGSLHLLDPDGQHLRGLSELPDEGRPGTVLSLDDLPNTRRALDARQPHFFTVEEGGAVEQEWMRRSGVWAWLVVPLLLDERCIGFFFVIYEPEGYAPTADEVVFAKAIAAQCALAIGRIRAADAERDARREAEHVAGLLEQLMAVVGHDLRSPLAAITMAATLMLRREKVSPDQERWLGRINASAARMAAIIRDLLDFSRARQGLGIAIQSCELDLGDVCRRVLAEFEGGGRRVALLAEGDLLVDGDGSRLGQVLSNLVGNALQHGAGSEVQVRASGGDDGVVITVHNEGPPIPPALLPHVFEPFRRGEHAAEQRGASNSIGLGLFIVGEVVKAHGGTVAVRSQPGSGTTFAVSLPRHGTGSPGHVQA